MATTDELLDQMVRLQALQIRLTLPSQADAIIELGKAGLNPTRIADLLGTTPGTAKTTLQRAKGKPRAARKPNIEEYGKNG
jgi:DNA-directed RNA polymerase specialized sigma24 family protein